MHPLGTKVYLLKRYSPSDSFWKKKIVKQKNSLKAEGGWVRQVQKDTYKLGVTAHTLCCG